MHSLLLTRRKFDRTTIRPVPLVKKESTAAMVIRVLFRPRAFPGRVQAVFDRCDKAFDELNADLDAMAKGPK